MYGLVNKAVEQMVCSHFSAETWDTIKQHAGVDITTFVSLRPYPDDMTYQLVDSAHHTLGLSHADILRAFGRYWVLYTAAEGYGELLNVTGRTFEEFMENLPNLHTRVSLSYPELVPPNFDTEPFDGGVLVHYHSERQGLTPMVVGLLEGLAERFQIAIAIELIASREAGDDHDIFRIDYK